MTLAEAKQLRRGQTVYELHAFNADGTPRRWIVNGQVHLWKRDAGRVSVPVKHGLYTYDHITEHALSYYTLTEPTRKGG